MGEHLSYPQEKLTDGTAEELAGRQFDPLAAMLITAAPTPSRSYPAIGLDDAEFLRGDEGKPIPMTKQEIRAVAVSRLHIQPAFCVYDVGAGTGSVTVEASLLAPGRSGVCRREKSESGRAAAAKPQTFFPHQRRGGRGDGPRCFVRTARAGTRSLSVARRGISGRLSACAWPKIRRSASWRPAITLETVAQLLEAARGLPEVSLEISQISAARARALGKEQQMHLMMGQNPVFVCCLTPAKGGRMMNTPRLMLAAASSGCGKTTVACAILQALKVRGISCVSYKCGPDYIDPMFHRQVLGIASRNLDLFFVPEQTARFLLQKSSRGADLAFIEGVMGYYDGIASTSTASSWHLPARPGPRRAGAQLPGDVGLDCGAAWGVPEL